MSLYHASIGFPATVRLWAGTVRLRYSKHAHSALVDRYGFITPPETFDLGAHRPFEIEVVGGRVVKACYRVRHTPGHDLSLVLHADGFVRTVWLNAADDHHTTLDTTKYTPVGPDCGEPGAGHSCGA